MTPEERGALMSLRNLAHGAPYNQGQLAVRLRRVDLLLAKEHPRFAAYMRERGHRIDYYGIAGNLLDKLGQHR